MAHAFAIPSFSRSGICRCLDTDCAPAVVLPLNAVHASRMEDEPASDALALVTLARQGDESGQHRLILAYQRRIAAFVYTVSGSAADVDDLTQQVLLRMLAGLPKLRDASCFEAWLFRLARNICIDHLRRARWRRFLSPLEAVHEETVAASPGCDPELLDALQHALQQVSPTDRAILALAADGRTIEEMQQTLGKSAAAVKVMLHRARERLKRHYDTTDHA